MDSTPQSATITPMAQPPQVLRTAGAAITAGAVLVGLSILYGFGTFLVMAGLTPITPGHEVVLWALIGNGLLALGLLGFIGWELSKLFAARRQRIAGARLHARIVGLFVLASAVPAVLMASAASVTLDKGFDSLFSASTKAVYRNSVGLAETYMRETNAGLRADLLQLAFVLNGLGNLIDTDKERFDEVVRTQAQLSALDGVYVIRRDRSVITKVVARPEDRFNVPSDADMTEADTGRPVLKPVNQQREVAGLIRLPAIEDAYLYIARRLEPLVLGQLEAAADEALRYNEMESRRVGMQLALTLMYAAIGLILVFSAIWMGFWLANRLVAPIRRLIGAAEQVSRGNLDTTVPVKPSEGELASLGMTFNDMTTQLRSQHGALIDANAMLDHRRRFTEAVLGGVTAGVIGLDTRGVVNLVNRSGEAILETDSETLVGKALGEEVPELAPLLAECIGRARRRAEAQIILRNESGERTVIVRVTSEGAARNTEGYVVTMDDITELVAAQRTSAWADVARRIAHEIKNPLTPIQLSAERLQRKYGKVIENDREVFEQCTETIIRQVGDIGRMVDEFSSFARMPKAVMGEHDVAEIVRQSTFLISVAHPDITFDARVGEGPVPVQCDRRLLSQAITNLIKNATEAFANAGMGEGEAPWIRVELDAEAGSASYVIRIIDNGVGFPARNRNRLLEPYMTTREKGTGLGLAIVQKIIEDHGGRMSLEDAPQVAEGGHGAMVLIVLPKRTPLAEDGADGTDQRAPAEAPDARKARHGTRGAGDDGAAEQ